MNVIVRPCVAIDFHKSVTRENTEEISTESKPKKEQVMKTGNPYNICTWDEQSDCANCSVQGKLHCKWDRRILYGFYAASFPPLIIAILGMVIVGVLTGVWWMLIAYIVYVPVMLGILETRFLCSHCPYYAEDSTMLHCLANHGDPKLWRYRPGPMSGLEKFMMLFLVITVIFFLAPLAVEGYGIYFIIAKYMEYGLISLLGLAGITLASLLTGISFILVLRTFFCSTCVNFSCPVNTVPKTVIDEYLKKNGVMRKAWEESGWRIGEITY
ncbi:MAG: hypothetical protein P8105_00565 [Dehalococcoidia bacterium]